MGKIVAVFNQKGGVAKTATINNLAFELHARGKKVLMVDADQQENLPISVGIIPRNLNRTIFDLISYEIEDIPYKSDLSEFIVPTEFGVDIIPGSVQMAEMDIKMFEASEHQTPLDRFLEAYKNDYSLQEKAADVGLDSGIEKFIKLKAGYDSLRAELLVELGKEGFLTEKDSDFILKKILSGVKSKYDYVLVDCPPALSAITQNILYAADRVLVPMTLDPFSASGISHLVTSIDTIKKKNPKLKISGLIRTMVDKNLILTKEISDQIDFYRQFMHIYETQIPRSTEVNKAFAERTPLILYNKNNAARMGYSEFCDEFLKREE